MCCVAAFELKQDLKRHNFQYNGKPNYLIIIYIYKIKNKRIIIAK